MKKWLIIGGALLASYLFIFSPLMNQRNRLVLTDQKVERSIGLWQSQLQRQADLLPNLANTVQGAASHERGTQTAVAEARSQATAISKIDPTKIANDPNLQRQLLEAQSSVGRAVLQVNAAREATPNLQAVELFRDLTKEISGTQNRITQARNDTVNAINEYNTQVRMWPMALFATVFGFSLRPNFQASTQATPEIKFN